MTEEYQPEDPHTLAQHLLDVAKVREKVGNAVFSLGSDPEAAALQAAVDALGTTLGAAPTATTVTQNELSDVEWACTLVKARRHAREAAWQELNNKSKD
jgi:hypothetical protein